MSRRYPFEPLLRLLEADGMSRNDIRAMLGVSGSNWSAAFTKGLMVKTADRFAVTAGFHPSEVWPTWHQDALEDHGQACAYCSGLFLPRQRNQRFCPGRECAQRWHARERQRRIRATPEGAAANRARTDAWRAALSPAAKRAALAKQRVRDQRRHEAKRQSPSTSQATWSNVA